MLLVLLSLVNSKRTHRVRFPFKSGPKLRPKRDTRFNMKSRLTQAADQEIQPHLAALQLL